MRARPCSILCVVLTAACTGDDTNPPAPPAADASTADATTASSSDASTANDSASADSAPAPLDVALVRLANWSPDSPAIDFCLAAHGTSAFQGPVLAEQSAKLDAATHASLTYPSATAYFQVPAGQYDARVVAGGASDCNVGVTTDLTSLAPWAMGSFATVALVGSVGAVAAQKLSLVAFTDDGIGGAKLSLRFINAASGAPIDFGMGSAAAFAPLFRGVAFGAANGIVDAGGADGAVKFDNNGYALLPAFSSATLSARKDGVTQDSVVAHGISIAAGAAVTTVLLGSSVADDAGTAMNLLECIDNAGTAGVVGSCSVLGP